MTTRTPLEKQPPRGLIPPDIWREMERNHTRPKGQKKEESVWLVVATAATHTEHVVQLHREVRTQPPPAHDHIP